MRSALTFPVMLLALYASQTAAVRGEACIADQRGGLVCGEGKGALRVFANTISSTNAFSIGGMTFKLGQKGQGFRETVTGRLNATPPPTGYFGGYAAGAGGNSAASREEHRPSER